MRFLSRREEPGSARFSRRLALAAIAAVLITIYGGLLRLEVLYAHYGRLDQPRWSTSMAQRVVPVARALRPDSVQWGPVEQPYVGGDPVNYLRFAREMTHFYQGHVREPVFLALTRTYLWLTGNRDIAVSFASATASTLAILATFLLGTAAVSPIVGLVAAAALAIELEAIAWSSEGWRDDTFMLFMTLTAWAFVRLHKEASPGRAVTAGIVAAGACLTRLSALSFVLPGLVWLWLDTPRQQRRAAAKHSGAAFLICGLLVAPYLINCARVTGDPFVAVNYHTRYYRHADGLTEDQSVSALGYVRDKVTARPVRALDTGITGLVFWPFNNKWNGFRNWSSNLGPVLRASAAVGMVLALWFPSGRLLLVLLFSSLVPYSLTWSSGGGGEWRFTQHVYPLYLVLAVGVWYGLAAAIAALARRRVDWRRPLTMRRAIEISVVGLVLTLAAIGYAALPFLVAREDLLAGEAVNLAAGPRDRVFFAGNWSSPLDNGVVVRAAQSTVVSMRVPTPEKRGYTMTLRMDPPEVADPAHPPEVTVFLNRRPLLRARMGQDPQRMGTYRVAVPPDFADRQIGRLEFLTTRTVPASTAGRFFSALAGDSPVAFRLWYVRIDPVQPRPVSSNQVAIPPADDESRRRSNRPNLSGTGGGR
jgi:hypothetical protein